MAKQDEILRAEGATKAMGWVLKAKAASGDPGAIISFFPKNALAFVKSQDKINLHSMEGALALLRSCIEALVCRR